MYQFHRRCFDEQLFCSIIPVVTKLKKHSKLMTCSNLYLFNEIIKKLPLFERQILSIPFLCSAILANSQNDSLILKSHSGEISKQAILLRDAYNSACFAATCLLNAKCNLLPTNTFGTPGACCGKNKFF